MNQYFINNETVKVRICDWGSSENPAIICFHGLGSTNLSFLELGEMLKDKYYVISVELPGHGKTPAFETEEEFGIPNLINLVHNIVKLLEINSFYILAHSWGGCIALHYAAKYSKRVKKILLLDGGYQNKQDIYKYFLKIDKRTLDFEPSCSLDEEIKEYENDFDNYVFSGWEDFLKSEENNYLRWSELLEVASKDLMKENDDKSVSFCASGSTAKSAIKSMYNFPTYDIYDKLKMPILLLQASLPESWNKIRSILSCEFQKRTGSFVKKVEATHMLHWDDPFTVRDEILEYFK